MKLLLLNLLAIFSAFMAIGGDVITKTWALNKRTMFFIVAFLLYSVSNLFWMFFLRDVRLSVAVAWWEAIGVVPAILVGIFYFKEQLNVFEVLAILLVLAGILMLNLSHAQ